MPHAGNESLLRLEDDSALAEVVRRLVQAYVPQRIYLLGSRVRGEVTPDSDYDLLVVVPDDASGERRRSRLGYQVLRRTGVAVDVVVWAADAFRCRLPLRASLPATVLAEGKLVYAA